MLASLVAGAPASGGHGRLAELELGLTRTADEAATPVLAEIHEELLGLVTFQVDGVAHPPVTLELCRKDEDAFYNPCGLRLDRAAADRRSAARIKVPRGSKLLLGATHPGAKRLRERTNDWVVVLHNDEALEGKPAPVGATYWAGDGSLEVDHLGPEHRYLQVIVSDPDRVWREKLMWILDRGRAPRSPAAGDRTE